MKQRVAIASVIVLGVVILAWSFSNAFVSEASRECARLYRAARSAADTAAADTTVPSGSYQTTEPRSCGSFRSAARWIAQP